MQLSIAQKAEIMIDGLNKTMFTGSISEYTHNNYYSQCTFTVCPLQLVATTVTEVIVTLYSERSYDEDHLYGVTS